MANGRISVYFNRLLLKTSRLLTTLFLILKIHPNLFSAKGYVAEDILQYLLCFLLPRVKADAVAFMQIHIHIPPQNMEELRINVEEKATFFYSVVMIFVSTSHLSPARAARIHTGVTDRCLLC